MRPKHGERPAVEIPASARGILKLVCLGAIIGAAYYAGAVVGLALKLPEATPSVMWPPNAILTSALLLTPGRLWPFALLSALPAHVALESGMGWPAGLVLALFATNCSEALMAAGGLRWLSDAPTRFDSLRRIAIFLGVAAIAAPVLSSFLDAAAVWRIQGEPYWEVWTARLASNCLTAMTVVPVLVMGVTSSRKWLTTAPRAQHLEALLLATSMILVSTVLLRRPGDGSMTSALADRALLAWLLPFLLWAAIRLGPGGLSVTLLGSALLLVGAAVTSHGPFQGLSPAETTLALQLFLIVVSFPLLVVAALVEERRLAQQDISNRFATEALLARLSGSFVHLPSTRMQDVFKHSLGEIGEFLQVECVLLYEYEPLSRGPVLVAGWGPPAHEQACEALARRAPLWPPARLLENEPVLVEPIPLNPADATACPFASSLAVPLWADDGLLGILACASTTSLAARPVLAEQLQAFASLLASALDRKHAEDALRASEAMKSAILSSLMHGVVVIDRDGRIVTVNERWHEMLPADAPPLLFERGADYLGYLRAAGRAGELWAMEAAEGIETVLTGARREFRLEHVQAFANGERTFVIRAVALDRPGGGAVISHLDLTDQRRAELEAQRARAELAHVSRVATMGALTASIAHQLNQPLSGILINAQAARRFLAASPPDLEEVRASLDDIVEDDRRASDVIVRMRALLRKDDGLESLIDLNAVVADVARLVGSDAIIRNVMLVLQLHEDPAVVRGDRVQLQQVVLNLIVNAMEALDDCPASNRRVIVRSRRQDSGDVEVSVIDNGSGFNGALDAAFDAFYTTKASGMGLGLSIARSIVEAHGGVIRGGNNNLGGATVSFRLPLAASESA